MPKIKIDVSGVSDDEATAWGGGFESPKPGVYRAKITEVNPGFAKDSSGEPDRSRPKLEIVYEIIGKEFTGANLWNHIPLKGSTSFGESSKKKMKQLLIATGQKSTAELETERIVGKIVRVRVRSGKAQDGETYRGEFAAMFKDDDSAVKLTGPGGGASSGDEELLDDEVTDEVVDDEVSEETDWDAHLAELTAMSVDDLKTIAKEWKAAGWDLTIGGTKAQLAEKVVAVEQAAAEQDESGGGDEVTDDDVILDDDEVTDDSTSDYLTEDQLKEMAPKDLMVLAKESFDIDAKEAGIKTKAAIIAAILEAQSAPSGDEDEELPW